MPGRRLAPLLLAFLLLPWYAAPADDDPGPARLLPPAHRPRHPRRAAPADRAAKRRILRGARAHLRALDACRRPALPALAHPPADAEGRRRAEECRHAIESPPDVAEVRAAAVSSPSAVRRAPPPSCSTTCRSRRRGDGRGAARGPHRAGRARRQAGAGAWSAPGRRRAGTRAAAAVALCRAGERGLLPAVRRLLKDPDPRVPCASASPWPTWARRTPLPVLIALLDVLPRNLLGPVEDLLYAHGRREGAGHRDGHHGRRPRRKFRDAWADWWAKEGAAADPPRPRDALPRPHRCPPARPWQDDRPGRRRPPGLGDQRPRSPARLAGACRASVYWSPTTRAAASWSAHHDGTILWEKDVGGPLVAQRLPDGNTFIATRTGIAGGRPGRHARLLLRPARRRGLHAHRPAAGRRRRLRRRPGACSVQPLRSPRPVGREKGNFAVNVQTYGGRIDVLPDGRVLVPVWGEIG